MSEIKDGGAMFGHGAENGHCCGATLRDWFAGQALVGLIHWSGMSAVDIARGQVKELSAIAYFLADAMIAEREKSK